jgi:hypothetical protein
MMRRINSIGRFVVFAAGVMFSLGPLGGCAMWHPDRWTLDRYRDQRAVDIEGRLAREKPIVANPF